MRIEAEILAEEGRHAPEHVPAMLDFDPRMSTIAMAYIGPPAVMLRLGLNAGNIYPQLAAHMGRFTARTLFGTSLLALDSTKHRYCGSRVELWQPPMTLDLQLAAHMGAFTALTLFGTSLLVLDSTEQSIGALIHCQLASNSNPVISHNRTRPGEAQSQQRCVSAAGCLEGCNSAAFAAEASCPCRQIMARYASDEMCRITEALTSLYI